MRNSVGRFSLENNQPLLFKTIADIASAADDKRRTESIHSIKTLNELTQELHNIGFEISRSRHTFLCFQKNITLRRLTPTEST